MKYILPISFLCGLIFFIAAPSLAKAATYYVAPNGSDTNGGTINAPYKTFLPAITRAAPGDTIYVRGGTYTEANAMVNAAERDWGSQGASSCPSGQLLVDSYCFYDVKTFIGINDFSGWASNATPYAVQSGTSSQPITVKNYPGERPVLDFSFHGTTGSSSAIYISKKAYWIIDGLEVNGGNINMWGGSGPSANTLTHDITIQNCIVHDLTIEGGVNPGLIRVDRADNGGAYNITIKNNTLYNLFDTASPGQWNGVVDMQHFGAVTTLSNCAYAGYAGGCTGLITIDGNTIYNVPQAFFFKNAMTGPIEIINNTIHDVDTLGNKQAGNVHMYHNLVYNVDTGFWDSGADHGYAITDPLLANANGANAIIEYNTFIGLNQLFGITSGTGHTVGHNVFFGLTSRAAGAGWDTPSFITKSSVYQDQSDVSQSLLQQIHSDNNCFISPYNDFQMAARYMTAGIEHYTPSQARQTFGYDPNSQIIIQSNQSAIFADPNTHNYRLSNSGNCSGMGYYAITAAEVDVIINEDPVVINQNPANQNPTTTSTTSNTNAFIATGTGIGGGPQVRVFNASGNLLTQFFAFEPSFRGGISVATADINGDGTDEIVVGAGRGRRPEVKIFTRGGTVLGSFTAYIASFRGGVRIAGGDINGDGIDEIITSAGPGGGPHLRVFSKPGATWQPISGLDTMAYDARFRGGISVTTADTNGDGIDEIVTAPNTGGGPNIRIFANRSNRLIPIQSGLMAYDSRFRGGVVVAGGNVNQSAADELITGVYANGGPQIRIFGQKRSSVSLLSGGFMAFAPQYRGGINIATTDTTGDGIDEIITTPNTNSEPIVRILSPTGRLLLQFFAYSRSFKGGITVAAGK